MKPLLFFPLFFLLQPLCSIRAADTSASGGNSTTSATTATSRSESDPSAKKNSASPSAPRTTAPKQNRAAPPAYLFMEE